VLSGCTLVQILIHNWRAGAVVSSTKGGSDKILSAAFAPDDSFLVTAGIDHVCFWVRNAAGTTYRQQRGVLGSVSKVQPFISIAFAGNNAVLGGADGSLVLFNEEFKATGAIPAHEGPVTAMFSDNKGTILTGGQDGNLKIWKSKGKLTETASYNFGSGIRSACVEAGQDILVGTEKSEIFTVCACARACVCLRAWLVLPLYLFWWHRSEGCCSPLSSALLVVLGFADDHVGQEDAHF
jgi:WD40 repeat protein